MGNHDPRLESIRKIARQTAAADPAHDFSHCLRVLANALQISRQEGGDAEILEAASFLHDIANLPKSHPDSRLSSERSASAAEKILAENGFSADQIEKAKDAILCHSYSRGLTPRTLEGRIFQDADRLDSLGAIGIARTFTVGGATNRPIYDLEDPFFASGRASREYDDKSNTLDHFFVKLFKLGETMQTDTGRKLAQERIERMKLFVENLRTEITAEATR